MLLPLTPFEEYMFLDGTMSYPMNCFIRFRFSGRFEPDRFQRALENALLLHPLLQAKIVCPRKNRYFWDMAAMPVPFTCRDNAENDSTPSGRPYDLFAEPPLRVTMSNFSSGGCELFLELHHSAADAAGIMLFVEHLLENYRLDKPKESPDREKLLRSLESRSRFAESWRELFAAMPSQLFGFARAWYFLGRRPDTVVPYVPPQDRPAPPDGFPFLLERNLSGEQTAELRRKAKQNGAAVNDLLLDAAFRGLFAWRRAENIAETGRWLRIAVPTNLRRDAKETLSTVNRVSMVFLDRKSHAAEHQDRLLAGIHREMAHIKRHRLGWAFIFGLSAFKRFFGGFHGMIRQKRCWSSCVLTNLGRAFENTSLPVRDGKICIPGAMNGDELRLERISASPPIRPWTPVGINALTYAGELSLTLHYDPVAFTPDAAERLFHHFIDALLG